MTKISVRLTSPQPPPGSFMAEPRTFWRAGTQYGRIAEATDYRNHIHELIVIHEPDVWMVNLYAKSAKHIVDQTPPLAVHMPVFAGAGEEKMQIAQLEFGKELEFFTANHATQTPATLGGKQTKRYEATVAGETLILWVDSNTAKPVRISHVKSAETRTLDYLEFEELPFDASLFQLPKGISVESSSSEDTSAQGTHAVVKVDSLPVYSSLEVRRTGVPVPTLSRGTIVNVEWSVANGQGERCNISSKDGSVKLGWVDCNGLDIKTTPVGKATAVTATPALAAAAVEQLGPGSQTVTPAQKAWGLAASALITEFNRHRHDILAGTALTPENRDEERRSLQTWWNAGDRNGLLQAMSWIEQGGHRSQFEELGERVSQLSSEQVKEVVAQLDPEAANAVLVARRYYQKLGKVGIIGWDYARYISLCRWGYRAGYLSEDEAWNGIVEASRVLQKNFGSWRELGENYLIGREFWSLRQTQLDGAGMRAAYTRLLNNPNSPWNRTSWNVDLR